jgi:hypothetical protein
MFWQFRASKATVGPVGFPEACVYTKKMCEVMNKKSRPGEEHIKVG